MITTTADGKVTFRIFLPHAASVEVVGDFTNWRVRKVAMRRENPGWWSITLAVPPGEHEFSYLVDGSIYLADYAAHGVKLNSYGGWISRLAIPAAPAGVELKASDLVAA